MTIVALSISKATQDYQGNIKNRFLLQYFFFLQKTLSQSISVTLQRGSGIGQVTM